MEHKETPTGTGRLPRLALAILLGAGLTLTPAAAWADQDGDATADPTVQSQQADQAPADGDPQAPDTGTTPDTGADTTTDGQDATDTPTDGEDATTEGEDTPDAPTEGEGTDATQTDPAPDADQPSMAALAAREATAAGLPVHKFDLEKVPAAYGGFKFSTQKVSRSQITIPSGQSGKWSVRDNPDPAFPGIHWRPKAKGATVVLTGAGRWTDTATNTTRNIDARITVNDWNDAALRLDANGALYVQSGYWGTQTDQGTMKNGNIDLTITFLDHATGKAVPSTFKGVTGFGDLDGDPARPNNPIEGYELVSGFSTAWIRSDTHLVQYVTNGWAGARDQNNNTDPQTGHHAMQHYLGATFTGPTIRVRSNTHGTYYGTYFQPMDNIMAPTHRLVYDLNGGTGTNPAAAGCPTQYGTRATATLATAATDTDCWDKSKATKKGATFLGWSTKRVNDITTPAQQAAAGITGKVTFASKDITVWAVWATMPTLSYDTNIPAEYTGTKRPATPASTTVPWNTPVANTSRWKTGDTTLIRGWRFDGWATTKGGTDWYWKNGNPNLTTNTTVHAHWTRLAVHIHYDPNGGQGSHKDTDAWQWSDATIPADTSRSFHRSLRRFTGWNTKPDGTGTTWQDGGTITLQDKDVTLYAQWAGVTASLPLTGNAGTPGTLAWLLPGLAATGGAIGAGWALLRRLTRRDPRHGDR